MTYVLCDNDQCINHDGDGCTLEFIEISNITTRSKAPQCLDHTETVDDD